MSKAKKTSTALPAAPSPSPPSRPVSLTEADVRRLVRAELEALVGQRCSSCQGAGMIPQRGSPAIYCTKCKGRGYIKA